MISANQKYKQSGTTKSFKEWLIEEQSQGGLQVHNKNDLSSSNSVDNRKFYISNANRNILIVLGIVAIGYGYHRFKNKV